ncbi:hypothetical protein FC91_GL002655 [Schleiferilactobacillus harbinensis DSM 16991]|uniref:Uncharacterized protein n=1 Tax=Schleiferilactobacillus harbinensis DSM 16991 TaxID=1122147 RepID=A0A0R1XB46_9LACO|nr:hypothetical protein FC91_GL002655 [Schleiferilactobacillus harbinensis DSM 16991]
MELKSARKSPFGTRKSGSRVRETKGTRVFNVVNIIILSLFTLIIVVPLWNIVISSFASSTALSNGNFIFWPQQLSLDNYRAVFRDPGLWRSFFISFAKTAVGVITHTLFCAIVAYPLSKRRLRGRKLYSTMGIITMFFSGGMIPTYLLIKSLGMLDTFWVYIIPSLFSYYDVIILMNFFRQVPDSLEESAKIDGPVITRCSGALFCPYPNRP